MGAMQNTPSLDDALAMLSGIPAGFYALTTGHDNDESDWYVDIEAGGYEFIITRDELEICDERGKRLWVMIDADDPRAWGACQIVDGLFDIEVEHQMSEANERAAMEANDRAMSEWCCKNL